VAEGPFGTTARVAVGVVGGVVGVNNVAVDTSDGDRLIAVVMGSGENHFSITGEPSNAAIIVPTKPIKATIIAVFSLRDDFIFLEVV
jgi:hypothetical protein